MLIKKAILLSILVLLCNQAIAAQLPVSVGSPGSKQSLDTNFGNTHLNFTELYGNINQGVKTTDSPSFVAVGSSGGNISASGSQVTKKWIAGLSYTADVSSVIYGGRHFVCTSTHTSSTTTEPGVGPSWLTAWKPAAEPPVTTVRSTAGGGSTTLPPSEAATGDALAGKEPALNAASVVAKFGAGACTGYLKSDGSCDAPEGAGDMYLAVPQSVSGEKTYDSSAISVKGSSTGKTTIASANASATNYVATMPAKSGTYAFTSDITGTNSNTNTGDNATNTQYGGLITSKTANYVYAAPNGSAGVPTFRALVAADIPTLNQSTTGSAATLTTPRTINGQSFNGSANITIPATGIPIVDAGGYLTGTELEAVLQELAAKIPTGADGNRGLKATENTINYSAEEAGYFVYTSKSGVPHYYGGTTDYVLTRTIVSGTSALGTGEISSGACATVVTTSATGVATTDVVEWGFNTRISQVTGYSGAATGSLRIDAYPTSNNVNFEVCNPTASSITPGAVTLNWSIRR